MPIGPGQRLLHYRLVEKVGEGGMGVVWKAVDTTLDREVAIKVLPDWGQSPGGPSASIDDRFARFEREAKLLAALNHPNIATVHGLHEDRGIRFLAMELIAGEDLAHRVERGPLPAKEALEIGRQIAEALEAAHEHGVMHRDLKPGNVLVTPEGMVKVLDFGLAKELAPAQESGSRSVSPTITSAGTAAGVILGTAAYMSPEQARGKPVDKRTDVWSFGCLLYETLTARRPFEGKTVSDTIAKILERDPDWEALRERAPARVVELLRRCTNKDPRRRLRDIGDARIEIEEILEHPAEAAEVATGAPAATRSRSPWFVAAVAVVFALVGALTARLLLPTPTSETSGDHREVVQVTRLTHDTGLSEWPSWSPDGSLLAFAADRDGDFEIYVRRVDGGQDVNVTNDLGQDFQPAFSPDGNAIAFVSTRSSKTGMVKIGATWGIEFRTLGGDLWMVPALGGQARRLASDANFPAWHPDGSRIGYVSGTENHRSILEVGVDGGPPQTVLDVSSSTWEIVRLKYSPNGKWISFENLQADVFLMPAEGGAPRKLITATSHVWDATGERIYYLVRDQSGGTRLLSVEIDQESGETRGEPQAFGLMTGFLRDLAVSRDGRQLAAAELEGSLNLTLLPLTPGGDAPAGPEQILSTGQVIDRYPFASDRLGPMEIWIHDLDTEKQTPLRLPGEDQGANLVYWAPDGKNVAITRSVEGGLQSIWLAAVDGSHAEELVPPTRSLLGDPFSPDGTSLLYAAPVDEIRQLFVLDVATRETRQLTSYPWDSLSGEWSPDGRSLAVVSNRGGAVQIWSMPASGGEMEPLTSGDERVRHASYSPDGRWVYFQPSHRNIYRVPATGGEFQKITNFPESGLFIEEPALSPDGRSLAYCRSNGGSSLWVFEIGDR
jgi:Tol biopolymer transport system component